MCIISTFSPPSLYLKLTDTQAENYRAYKVFSMMDVDGGGSISLRELNRVLMGEVIRFVSCFFEHPDSGMVFGLDEENCVCITEIEAKSAASAFPFLIERMRLHTINNYIVKQYDRKALQAVYEELLRLHDEPMKLTFHEPMLIINQFSCALDLAVEDERYSVMLPPGAVYSASTLCNKIESSLTAIDDKLAYIKVGFDRQKKQISFECEQYKFQLLFATGTNCRRSCRYAFGFSAEDTPAQKIHVGQPMLMNLNLGISQEKMEILMRELFEQYDRDGSGEFEFEEFRDFYIKYLDSDKSIERLRQYAQFRFRDVEREKFVKQQQYERKLKGERRRYLKQKNAPLLKKQKEKFKNDSYMDPFGNRRRKYRHRTLQAMQGRGEVVEAKAESKVDEQIDTFEEGSDAGFPEAAKQNEQLHEELRQVQERNLQKREENRAKHLQQAERRRRVIHKILEENLELKRKEKKTNAVSINDMVTMQLVELQYQIKKQLMNNLKMSSGMPKIGVCVDRIVTSPAVTVHEGVLNNTYNPSPNMVEIKPVTSSVLHPAMLNYYCLKEKQKDRKEVFNPEHMHPAFFTADFIRNNNRHSFTALSLARVMKGYRASGVKYRAQRGIERCYAVPPDEVRGGEAKSIQLRDGNKLRRKKVEFADMEVNQMNKPKSQSTVARITMVSIKVLKLQASSSPLNPLSPFVRLHCIAGQFATEPYFFAGKLYSYRLYLSHYG